MASGIIARKYYLKRKARGDRTYLIHDSPEMIAKIKLYYHQLKGMPEEPPKPN